MALAGRQRHRTQEVIHHVPPQVRPLPDSDLPSLTNPANFSLILGGHLYQLWIRAHLGDIEPHIRRRILILCELCWLPLLLCGWEGSLLQGGPSC